MPIGSYEMGFVQCELTLRQDFKDRPTRGRLGSRLTMLTRLVVLHHRVTA